MVRFTFAQSIALAPIFAATLTQARPSYPALLPNGENPELPCPELGHIDCAAGGPRNQFGLDFAANDRTWDETLCMMDSDGDGLTNGEELGDPCCTWRSGDGDEGLRLDNVSHPGDAESTEAEGQEGCPDGGAAAPAAPIVESPAAAGTAAPAATAAPTGDAAPVLQNPIIDNLPLPSAEAEAAQGVINRAAECFPADATVTLKDGSVVTMKDVQIGDEVLASMPDKYSPVYMFSHKEEKSVNDFIRIATSNGMSITASRGHYIVIDGRLKAAAAVVPGDKVITKSGDSVVATVEAVKAVGLYNPHTLAGSVVVDGVLASDVTTAVSPSVARALLAPFKFMYGVFQRDVSGGLLHKGWASLAKLAPVGAKEL